LLIIYIGLVSLIISCAQVQAIPRAKVRSCKIKKLYLYIKKLSTSTEIVMAAPSWSFETFSNPLFRISGSERSKKKKKNRSCGKYLEEHHPHI